MSSSPHERLRPVVDPDLPAGERAVLLSHAHALTPAGSPAPPPVPARWEFPFLQWVREHPVATLVVAVAGTLVGMRLLLRLFVFVLPLLLLAALIALVVTARRVTESPAQALARRHHGRYIVAEADLDEPARHLLARAQRAVDAVDAADVVASGHIDAIDNAVVLPRQVWEIATTLRRVTELRARAAEAEADLSGAQGLEDLLAERAAALEAAEASVTARIGALEGYAARVAEADESHRRLRAVERLLAEQEDYLDLMAATVADDYAADHIGELGERARTAQERLRRALAEAAEAGLRLPGESGEGRR
ncbi:hypothetical protein HDA32_002514 [Spinactinospora alkalitolerans]|uniref:Uncharacterized protein n=1 Tax=Spinactinospora alkalitolerans TaxID=687207 RepID=A0A852TZK0_9ACTN|nr:hypothetical protein [Spinactinospora alkalitolerans]NYE47394.1 hypothetical protein [Spinactinospora alkalitolerans]